MMFVIHLLFMPSKRCKETVWGALCVGYAKEGFIVACEAQNASTFTVLSSDPRSPWLACKRLASLKRRRRDFLSIQSIAVLDSDLFLRRSTTAVFWCNITHARFYYLRVILHSVANAPVLLAEAVRGWRSNSPSFTNLCFDNLLWSALTFKMTARENVSMCRELSSSPSQRSRGGWMRDESLPRSYSLIYLHLHVCPLQ